MLPPPPPPPPPLPPPPVPANQLAISKQPRIHQSLTIDIPTYENRSRKHTILHHPRRHRTNPIVWFGAIICLIFSLTLIFFGIATLVIYLAIKPRTPMFDTPNANLKSVYFDSPEYFNGDFTFLANFSNPNQKIDVRFEYVDIELYFYDRLIGIQALQPFTQRQHETRLETVHIISSLVYLPHNLAIELQKQVQSNKVIYNIRGTFKVRASLGLLHYSYWLHGRCEVMMTGPPAGVLVARSCKTKR
ncbi:uncharacterized protein LOC126686145 [Mercurialis annua]|uniref:uncharacterized protein LOC126686145 n=1 Tax=Mercurialis annua TaxID=3986 RepID=UPI00215FE432|nr:uncharacterized protein LOC126686145 [Mercurialis annua]